MERVAPIIRKTMIVMTLFLNNDEWEASIAIH